MLPLGRRPKIRRFRDEDPDGVPSSVPVVRLWCPEDADLEPTAVAPGATAARAQKMMDETEAAMRQAGRVSCIRELAGKRAADGRDVTLVNVDVVDLGWDEDADPTRVRLQLEELSSDELVDADEDDEAKEQSELAELVALFKSVPTTEPPPQRAAPPNTASRAWSPPPAPWQEMEEIDDVGALRPARMRGAPALIVVFASLACLFGLLAIFAR
jgi:hypothetical protein